MHNPLLHADAIKLSGELASSDAGRVDLVYVGPPFNAGGAFAARKQAANHAAG